MKNVNFSVEFANTAEWRQDGSSYGRFHKHLRESVWSTVGSESALHFSVERDAPEEAVGKILSTVAGWNESYSTLPAEHRAEVEREEARLEVEKAANRKGVDEIQRVVDRVISE
jgi:hypothetical protein